MRVCIFLLSIFSHNFWTSDKKHRVHKFNDQQHIFIYYLCNKPSSLSKILFSILFALFRRKGGYTFRSVQKKLTLFFLERMLVRFNGWFVWPLVFVRISCEINGYAMQYTKSLLTIFLEHCHLRAKRHKKSKSFCPNKKIKCVEYCHGTHNNDHGKRKKHLTIFPPPSTQPSQTFLILVSQ